jgi:hypothetical protein
MCSEQNRPKPIVTTMTETHAFLRACHIFTLSKNISGQSLNSIPSRDLSKRQTSNPIY